MPLGPAIRRMFGPYERTVTDAYRAIYVDVVDLVRLMKRWRPEARNILEVGCGEGAVTTLLRDAYPEADITAIDVTPRLGRLYSGETSQLTFRRCTVQEVASESPATFDLVVLSDVLHHVPLSARHDLMSALRGAVAPSGAVFFKEWARERTYWPIYWICWASDRWLTGDQIRYLRRAEMLALLEKTFGTDAVIESTVVRPWRNNVAFLIHA